MFTRTNQKLRHVCSKDNSIFFFFFDRVWIFRRQEMKIEIISHREEVFKRYTYSLYTTTTCPYYYIRTYILTWPIVFDSEGQVTKLYHVYSC